MDKHAVEAAYRRLEQSGGRQLYGYSFMYTPEATLRTASTVLVGLNPGGSQQDEPGEWDYAKGANAYADESWRGLAPGAHHLQREVCAAFDVLNVRPAHVFSAQFVPFRSPSWAALPGRAQALAFGRELWRWVVSRSPADLYLSLGKQAGREVAALLGARQIEVSRAGWGRQTIERYEDASGRTVLALPHLSRFKLFTTGRTEAAETLRRFRRA